MTCLKRRSMPRQADLGKRPFILYIAFLLTAVLSQQPVDPLGRRQQIAQGCVMIKVVDNEGDILAHIHINVVGSLKKIRSLIYQVRGQYPVNDSRQGSSLAEHTGPETRHPRDGKGEIIIIMCCFFREVYVSTSWNEF